MAELEGAFLRYLIRANNKQAKLLLSHATSEQLRAIGEVCLNLLHGEVNPELLKDVRPYKNLLRQLADKHLSGKRRREIASRRSKTVLEILRLVESILP